MARSDTVIKGVGIAKADSLGITDVIVKQFGLSKADVLAVADDVSKGFGLSLTDTMALADSMYKTGTFTYSGLQIIVELYNRAIEISNRRGG